MLGRMYRIPIGMNELALLPRAFSILILPRFQLLSSLCSTTQRAGNSLEGGWDASVLEQGEGSGRWKERQSVSETRQKPALEKNCSSGLVRTESKSPSL